MLAECWVVIRGCSILESSGGRIVYNHGGSFM